MSEIVAIYSHMGKTAEVIREDSGQLTVTFIKGGVWTHETTCTNINEATRLAEGYVNSGNSTLLNE
jgi:hypothetical protein